MRYKNLITQHSFLKKECTSRQHSVFYFFQSDKMRKHRRINFTRLLQTYNSLQHLLNTYPRKQIANLCTGKPILIMLLHKSIFYRKVMENSRFKTIDEVIKKCPTTYCAMVHQNTNFQLVMIRILCGLLDGILDP